MGKLWKILLGLAVGVLGIAVLMVYFPEVAEAAWKVVLTLVLIVFTLLMFINDEGDNEEDEDEEDEDEEDEDEDEDDDDPDEPIVRGVPIDERPEPEQEEARRRLEL